ncbi:MAG: cytosolic protein [Chrysiogenales bacterium]|nr:MAG: cytosolic protein [Chrysiogenales bacterium]
MKAGLLLTGNGALVYLTSHPDFIDKDLIRKFESKGIEKFIAYEIPADEAKKRYGGHFDIVVQDLKESDDLRILDYNGSRAFKMFSFKDLGSPIHHE